MKKPEIPLNELERLNALEEYNILDTLPEQEFDDLTKIASQICQTPISLISLIDDKRQWFKSHHGLSASETPKDVAFCAHAINDQAHIFSIPDSRLDHRFFDNPLVIGEPHVIFYTGVPLVTPDGFALGTLCVIDQEPKVLTPSQLDALQSLANQVIHLFELRKRNMQLSKTQYSLNERNKELERISYVVSHDIKSPLANVISLTQMLKSECSSQLDDQGNEILNFIGQSASGLMSFVNALLSFYRGDQIDAKLLDEIDFQEFLQSVVKKADVPILNCRFNYPKESITLHSSRVMLEQLYINLITNAIKYNDKEHIVIDFTVSEDDAYYNFSVTDNGIGIDPENQEKIFELFKNLDTKDRFGNYGTGIGLATVKKIIDRNGGSIRMTSVKNQGTTFEFSLKKVNG
jgi:signal transduction histidine kinase